MTALQDLDVIGGTSYDCLAESRRDRGNIVSLHNGI